MILSQLTITSPKPMKSTFLAWRCALNKIKTLNPHVPVNSSSSKQLKAKCQKPTKNANSADSRIIKQNLNGRIKP